MKYYTIISMGIVGGNYFSKIYILKNDFKNRKELEEEIKSLFDNCTIFISKETIWIIKTILCGKTLEKLDSRLGDCSLVVHDGEIFLGREVCDKCKQMVHKIIGECKETKFIPMNKYQQFFQRQKFLTFKEIPEKEVIGRLVWKKKEKGKDREYNEFIDAMKSTIGDGKTKDIQFKKDYAIYIDDDELAGGD